MEAGGLMEDSVHLYNGSTLAYIGDGVFELAVRKHVLATGETNTNRLHQLSVKYVGAKGQATVMKHWISQEDFLSEEELTMYKRGRNHKATTKAKNATIGEYRQATGFESLMGWLYLSQQTQRLEELMQVAIDFIDNKEGEGL